MYVVCSLPDSALRTNVHWHHKCCIPFNYIHVYTCRKKFAPRLSIRDMGWKCGLGARIVLYTNLQKGIHYYQTWQVFCETGPISIMNNNELYMCYIGCAAMQEGTCIYKLNQFAFMKGQGTYTNQNRAAQQDKPRLLLEMICSKAHIILSPLKVAVALYYSTFKYLFYGHWKQKLLSTPTGCNAWLAYHNLQCLTCCQ